MRSVMRLFRSLKFLFFLLAPAFFSGCASNPTFLTVIPQKSEQQEFVYINGQEILSSSGAVSVGASTVRNLPSDSEYLQLGLMFVNGSDTSYDILLDKFSAHDQDGNALKVLTPTEQAVEVDDKVKGKRIGLALQGFGAALQDTGTATHEGTIQGNTYSGTSTYHDNSMEKAQIQNNIQSLNSTVETEKSFYLQNHTLFPGQAHAGIIWVAVPTMQQASYGISLEVPVGDEVHSFLYLISSPAPN